MPSAAIFPASLAIPRPSNRSLCSCRALSGPYLFSPLPVSSVTSFSYFASPFIIRMGGGPRTYPGGVSKWQWKRMQDEKAKQLLKARLCRERQLYEMRKRAELKAAISELERPWELVERAPVLFSASADEQVKVLADRFRRPTGFDMWSERDGPQIFRSPDNLPSSRFFPKGAVNSVKPYGIVAGELADSVEEGEEKMRCADGIEGGAGGIGRGRRVRRVLSDLSLMESERSVPEVGQNTDSGENWGSYASDSELMVAVSKKAEDQMSGDFDRHGENMDSNGLDSEVAIAGSRMSGKETSVPRGRRLRRVLSDSSSLKSDLSVRGEGGNGDTGGNRASYGSESELVVAGSRKEEDEKAGGFLRQWGNRDSSGSDSELAVSGSRIYGDEMTGDFGRRSGCSRDWDSRSSDSELTSTGSRMEKHEVARGYSRRGGRGSRGRGSRGGYGGSYRSNSELAVNGSGMEVDKLGRDFRGVSDLDLGSYGSYSKLEVAGSSKEVHEMAGSFDRRGGRGGNRGSYRSTSEFPVTRSRIEGDEITRSFGIRGGRRGNRSFYGSDSELSTADSRKGRVEMASGFNRSRGDVRGRGYSNRGRVSLRPSTELMLDGGNRRFEPAAVGSGIDGDEMTGDFRRRGSHVRNWGSRGSYSELADAGPRMGRHELAGGSGQFGDRGGRSRYRGSNRSYSVPDSRTEGDKFGGDFHQRDDGNRNLGSYGSRMQRHEIASSFHRRGGRGGNRGSYRSYSELPGTRSSVERDEITGGLKKLCGRGGNRSFHGSDSEPAAAESWKGRVEMARGSNRPRGRGRGRGYSYGGRVSLRPSTELRSEEVG